MSSTKELRHRFFLSMLAALRVVWPILSALLVLVAALGLVIALNEGWGLFEGIYFAFVTGLTVGYGDLVPKQTLSRILAIAIGFHGVLLTALLAAVSVRALDATMQDAPSPRPDRDSIP